MKEPPGHKPPVVNVVVIGSFEEDEEETGVASNVVKVKDEDLAAPGPLKRNDPGTVTIPQYRVNKTKQHTHGIASDVVKAEGEDLATPGFLRSVNTRKPQDRNDSPILV